MTAIKQADSVIARKGRHKSRRQIAKGWEFLFWWKDGSETWTPLKYMKEADRATWAKMTTASGTESWTQLSDKYFMASI